MLDWGLLKKVCHLLPAVSDCTFTLLPLAPVTVSVPAKLKTGRLLVAAWNCTTLLAVTAF